MADSHPAKEKRVLSTTWVGLLYGLLSLFFAGMVVGNWSNPPKFNWMWPVILALGLVSIVMTLFGARKSSRLGNQIVASLAIGVCLVSNWIVDNNYFQNYHTYPWVVLFGFTIASTVFAWMSRLRIVSLLSLAFLGYWFYGAFLPGSTEDWLIRKSDGLICSMRPNHGITFSLRNLKGTNLGDVIDADKIAVEASISPLIPDLHGRARYAGKGESIDRSPEAPFAPRIHLPPWTKSVDFKVKVQRWPVQSLSHLSIFLTYLPTSIAASLSDPHQFSASFIEWSKSQATWPPEPCLSFQIRYQGFDYSGFRGNEIGVTDDYGHHLPIRVQSVSGDGGETVLNVEVSADTKIKKLGLDLYSEAQRAKATTIFDMGRVTVPTQEP